MFVVRSGNGFVAKSDLEVEGDLPEMTSDRKSALRMDHAAAFGLATIMSTAGLEAKIESAMSPEELLDLFATAVSYLLVRANRERKLSHLLVGSEAYDRLIHAFAARYDVDLGETACMRSPSDIHDIVSKAAAARRKA
jgi:hypothetical protein